MIYSLVIFLVLYLLQLKNVTVKPEDYIKVLHHILQEYERYNGGLSNLINQVQKVAIPTWVFTKLKSIDGLGDIFF